MAARCLGAVVILVALGPLACGRSGTIDSLLGGDGGPDFPLPQLRLPGATATPTPTGTPSVLAVDWVSVIEGPEDDIAYAAGVGNGRAGCAGSFRGTAQLGVVDSFAFGLEPVLATSNGLEDVFIAVYDETDGGYRWHDAAGGAAFDAAFALALHADGRAAAGGRFDSASIDFGPGGGALNNSGGGDPFVATYDGQGQLLWDVDSTDTGNDEVRAMSFTGFVFSAGDADGAGTRDSFADRRVATTGALDGAVNDAEIGAAEFLRAVASESDGSSWVGAGYFTGTGDFGGDTLVAVNEDGMAWHCVTGQMGCIDWTFHATGALDERVTAVAHLADDDAWLIAGWFEGTATIAGVTLVSAGLRDVFFARVQAGGTVEWAIRAGGPGDDVVTAASAGPAGRAHVAGTYSGAFAPGPPFAPLPPASAGSFLLTLDDAGAIASVTGFGGEGVEVHGLAVSASDAVYLAGAFSGTVDLGTGPLTAQAKDAFLARGVMP